MTPLMQFGKSFKSSKPDDTPLVIQKQNTKPVEKQVPRKSIVSQKAAARKASTTNLPQRSPKSLGTEDLMPSGGVYEIVIDPEEEVLYEGELSKFKPGIEKNFIARWLQLSTRSFRYYKNHYHSVCYLTRPISAIPLNAI